MDATKQRIHPDVQKRIKMERDSWMHYSPDELMVLISEGFYGKVIGHAVQFASFIDLKKVADSLKNRNDLTQNQMLYIIFMAITLNSHRSKTMIKRIGYKNVSELSSDYLKMIELFDSDSEYMVKELLKKELVNRYIIENRSEEEQKLAAKSLQENSILSFVKTIISEVKNSELFKLEATKTSWGNDFSCFYQFALWCGAQFQTTNPPLILSAWKMDKEYWADKLITLNTDVGLISSDSSPLSKEELIIALATFVIVEENCLLSRDIFLASDGQLGFVCYQVNPHNHACPEKMIAEVEIVYDLMLKRLQGGEPNISFKLPGTKAGLEAAKILSQKGISLTITLCFGLFQAIPFSKVFAKSLAPTNGIVVMNGRLSYPVRDELESKYPGCKIHKDASKLAGVAVTKKLFNLLYKQQNYDSNKIRILNASLRIYGIEIPDVTEIWGTPAITIFPNVRHAMDATDRLLDDQSIEKPLERVYLDYLADSEIFRQAFWNNENSDEFKPSVVLDLVSSDESIVRSWTPIAETLSQFIKAYDDLKTIVLKYF